MFEATCDSEPDVEAFDQLAHQVLGGRVRFAVEPIDPDVNWVAKSLEGLQPVTGWLRHPEGERRPTEVVIDENGWQLTLDVAEGHQTG